jgi:phosphatidylglycerophosphate synthase
MKLNMHRAKKVPDWSAVAEAERNGWQRLAARTGGVVTPANAVTLIGAVVTLWGVGELLARAVWPAVILLVVGRLLDVADGWVAEHTGTKSGLGEILDAVTDKVVTVLTVVGMFLAQVAPAWLMGALVLPHIIITVITFIDRARGVELHPSRLGKTTMLLAWIAIPLMILVRAAHLASGNPFAILVTLFVLVSAAFGFITANSYLHPERESEPRQL